MVNKEKPFHTTKPIKRFSSTCSGIFDATLASYGFKRASKRIEKDFCSHIYIKKRGSDPDLYIQVFANTYFGDAPNYVGIDLGEGAYEMPEADWNKIALWQLIQARDPKRRKSAQGDRYGLPYTENLEKGLKRAAHNLFTFGQDFLSGDLTLFKKTRAQVNKSRSADVIYSPNPKSGRYKSRTDAAGKRSKERYSK